MRLLWTILLPLLWSYYCFFTTEPRSYHCPTLQVPPLLLLLLIFTTTYYALRLLRLLRLRLLLLLLSPGCSGAPLQLPACRTLLRVCIQITNKNMNHTKHLKIYWTNIKIINKSINKIKKDRALAGLWWRVGHIWLRTSYDDTDIPMTLLVMVLLWYVLVMDALYSTTLI